MRLSHITKHFAANVAADDVSLDFNPGEIVGLVGENGAGKTTLMSMAAGELSPDAGTIEDSESVGIVHQHFLLVNEFTIAENLALSMWGRDPTEIIRDSGIELRGVHRRVADLSVGEKSKLELIKAIAGHPRFLILDEPTSVLAPAEARELFDVMRRLAADGVTVVFISHKIPEVLEVASRIVVMRRGRIVVDGGAMSADQLAEAMVERRSPQTERRRPAGWAAGGSPAPAPPAGPPPVRRRYDSTRSKFTPAKSSPSSASPATASPSSPRNCATRCADASRTSPRTARATASSPK